MPSPRLVPELLTRKLRGRQVSHLLASDEQRLAIHFSDGAALVIELGTRGLVVKICNPTTSSKDHNTKQQPTARQAEYLAFIAKYIARFGRAPAESDIERHFLVSAPSVNQMMHTLERRGFITRQPGVPRSVRVCIELAGIRSGDTDC